MRLGLDVGSSSVKLAALSSAPQEALATRPTPSDNFRILPLQDGQCLIVSRYRRALGNPLQTAIDLLGEFRSAFPDFEIESLGVTGSGAHRTSEAVNGACHNEFKAVAAGVSAVCPGTRTVFEMGGESSKYILLDAPRDGPAGNRFLPEQTAGILDYSVSAECAAGTGSFIDQQASRLRYHVEDIGAVVAGARAAARIAGRCSVFAKSDMIHAQQKGYSTAEVLKGLCDAVARNFKSNIVKGKKVVPPVVFIGGVSQNSGVEQAMAEAFKLTPEQITVPELYAWMGAIGAALLEQPARRPQVICAGATDGQERRNGSTKAPAAHSPLGMENVLLLRDHPQAARTDPLPEIGAEKLPVYLGIDIGSVSTNLALLDTAGRLLHGIYLRTAGRPIEVVHEGLQEIERLFGAHISIQGVGTTGSGRELIGELVGADTVNDEITAHKTGAIFVHKKLVQDLSSRPGGNGAVPSIGEVDTIFEIGGQDSKFISIDHGVVVDFAMNEACAAGTGSFLEEQAERLAIKIKDEFALLALSSESPASLGERCTVFMERDVNFAMQRGAQIRDLAAGLACSVALNYLNRVVRGRKIGDVIYFQGGTAYNDAVAAAFSQVLGKRIIVPPHNGIIGAIGMALIAQEKAHTRARSQNAGLLAQSLSTFRGFDLNRTRFETREFVCKACSNYCDMKEITIEGQKTYWGDKCSDKFRKRARTEREPVIDDLLAFRDRLLINCHGGHDSHERNGNGHQGNGVRIGVPRAMFFYDRFPFWRAYLEHLGFEVMISEPTNSYSAARGAEICVAEQCFPVQIAHGHALELLTECPGRPPADYLLIPNIVDMEAPPASGPSQLCPWNQTLPFVVRATPELSAHASKFLTPTLYFRLGRAHVKRQLAEQFSRLGIGRRASDAAVDAAYAAQAEFTERLLAAGREACTRLDHTGEPAVLLAGRPYNMYDRNSNCDIPRKLRDLYGVNVLPLDFLPLDDEPPDGSDFNMYWNSGRRILAAGRFARRHPNLHIIYITNFKCGPDSFIKHFLREATDAPFLVLQFDGHGNDAGYLTRCEAYLDSKGLLRCSSVH